MERMFVDLFKGYHILYIYIEMYKSVLLKSLY